MLRDTVICTYLAQNTGIYMYVYTNLYDCVYVCAYVVNDWKMLEDSHRAYIPDKGIPVTSML